MFTILDSKQIPINKHVHERQIRSCWSDLIRTLDRTSFGRKSRHAPRILNMTKIKVAPRPFLIPTMLPKKFVILGGPQRTKALRSIDWLRPLLTQPSSVGGKLIAKFRQLRISFIWIIFVVDFIVGKIRVEDVWTRIFRYAACSSNSWTCTILSENRYQWELLIDRCG